MTTYALLTMVQASIAEGVVASPLLTLFVVMALVLASVAILFVSRYKRCPANRVLVISGRVGSGQSAKVFSGGGTFVWPVVQEWALMSLEPLQIDIPLTDALSLENIRVKVPSQVTVAIGDTPEYQHNAAARLLSLAADEIKDLAANIIFGQMRQVIASMRIEDINRDRDQFRTNIEHALEPELKKIGLKLINVNIKDLNDESGYIEAIGREAAARAINKAKGDVAEQEKMGSIAVARADQEKDIEVANADREKEIGVKGAERDKAVRIAELDRETVVAQQRAEFARDTEIAQADQARRTAVAAANAEAVQGEAEAKARIAGANAELKVREAEAFQKGETKKRVAEAAVLEEENRARAKAALAEAERIEAQRRAELEAPAKAEKARRIVEAEAVAEARRLEAEGEAKAIFAKLEAEARGEFEMLEKRAEGLKRIVEACGGADEAYRLLMLEHIPTLADKAAEAISNIRFDKVVMWGGTGQGAGAANGVSAFVTDLMGTLPPALHTMMNIGGLKVADGVIQLVEDEVAPEPGHAPATRVAKKVTVPAGNGAPDGEGKPGS